MTKGNKTEHEGGRKRAKKNQKGGRKGGREGGREFGKEGDVPGRCRMRPIQSPNSAVLGVVAERKMRETCAGSMMIT